MVVLEGDVEVLSNVLHFACSYIIILVEIIIIIGDVVNDIGCVASLTVALLGFWLTLISKLACLLNHFALWVDTGCL
jgi:hypothetical protein